jgi:hypothetical protein
MKADFLDAHIRHFDDAERLFKATRWANADHLYGMAAECGLKQLMIAFGMNVDLSTGSPVDKYDRFHANQAWTRFESYRSGHHTGVRYQLPPDDPFFDWDVSQRYAHQANFSRGVVEPHRKGAESVYELIAKAVFEGIVS